MKQALRLHPELSRLWFELGKLYLARKDPKSALAAFEKANRESESAEYWAAIAFTRRNLGESGRAADAWIRARTLMKDHPWQIGRVRLFWVESMRPGFDWQVRRRFRKWRNETKRILRLVNRLVAARRNVNEGKPLGLAAKFVPAKNLSSPRQMAEWLGQNHDSKFAAGRLSPAFVHTYLESLLASGTTLEDQSGIATAVNLVHRDLSREPMGGLERYNLANLYLCNGLA
jgi:tetratricopeptide (TPR) repeat protein